MPGLDGAEKMAALMKSLRETPPSEIAGVKVATYKDYSDGTARDAASGEVTKIALSGSNVLRFELCDGTHIVVRPSGTEPKIKVYILTKGSGCARARRKPRQILRPGQHPRLIFPNSTKAAEGGADHAPPSFNFSRIAAKG